MVLCVETVIVVSAMLHKIAQSVWIVDSPFIFKENLFFFPTHIFFSHAAACCFLVHVCVYCVGEGASFDGVMTIGASFIETSFIWNSESADSGLTVTLRASLASFLL